MMKQKHSQQNTHIREHEERERERDSIRADIIHTHVSVTGERERERQHQGYKRVTRHYSPLFIKRPVNGWH